MPLECINCRIYLSDDYKHTICFSKEKWEGTQSTANPDIPLMHQGLIGKYLNVVVALEGRKRDNTNEPNEFLVRLVSDKN